jgi:hypothetical protein
MASGRVLETDAYTPPLEALVRNGMIELPEVFDVSWTGDRAA